MVDNALGLGGMRQQHDHNVALRKKRVEAALSVMAGHALDLFGVPAPAGKVEPEGVELERSVLPQHAKPHDAYGNGAGGRLVQLTPLAPGLHFPVDAPLPHVVQHLPDDVFAHPVGQVARHDPHDRDFGQIGIGKNMIDACA